MKYLREEERKEKNQRTKQTKGKQENERNRSKCCCGSHAVSKCTLKKRSFGYSTCKSILLKLLQNLSNGFCLIYEGV